MKHHHPLRILAFDAHCRHFGYALLEGPKRLIDWGTGAIYANHRGSAAIAKVAKQIRRLLDHHPAIVVIKHVPRAGRNRNRAFALSPIAATIRRETSQRQIFLEAVSRAEIRDAFRPVCTPRKDDIAQVIAGMFPELRSRLPLQRNIYRSEPRGMRIFDAVATALAYCWTRHRIPISPPN